jgi:predicted secreted Zn-dependent protease
MMRISFVIIMAGLLVLAGCTSSTVTTGYFQVSGSTQKQLDRSFALNAPMNGHAFAATELRIVPVSFDPTEDTRGCYFRSAKFKIIAHISYPQWRNREGAPTDLKQGFDAFSRYARVHEEIHVKIGEAAARAMERAIEAIPAQRNCEMLLVKFKSAVKGIYAKHDKAQKAFDATENKRLAKLFKS